MKPSHPPSLKSNGSQPRNNGRKLTRALDLLRNHKGRSRELEQRRAVLLEMIQHSIVSNNAEGLKLWTDEMTELMSERERLDELAEPADDCHAYLFSSIDMVRSFRNLTKTPEEHACFVLGFDFEGISIGTHLLPFRYSKQSVTGLTGDHEATHRLAIMANDWKHRIITVLHSHPGISNQQSPTDRHTQRLWQCTANTISGIWGRGGELRFFSESLPFRVHIAGNHMECVSHAENSSVWKITKAA